VGDAVWGGVTCCPLFGVFCEGLGPNGWISGNSLIVLLLGLELAFWELWSMSRTISLDPAIGKP
jgi:hypothetical protein